MLQGLQIPQIAGRGYIYSAYCAVTPAIYSGTTLTGPLLYNGSASGGVKGVTAYLLAVSYGLSVASTVASSIGIVTGVTTAPTSTTGITLSGPLTPGVQAAACSVYNAGTVSAAGTAYLPTGHVHTGAITVDTDDDNFIHLGGAIVIPTGAFAAVASGATLTGATIGIGLVWMETAND